MGNVCTSDASITEDTPPNPLMKPTASVCNFLNLCVSSSFEFERKHSAASKSRIQNGGAKKKYNSAPVPKHLVCLFFFQV